MSALYHVPRRPVIPTFLRFEPARRMATIVY
jgi:hypothetical protein